MSRKSIVVPEGWSLDFDEVIEEGRLVRTLLMEGGKTENFDERSSHPAHTESYAGSCTCHYERCPWECPCRRCVCCGGRSWSGASLIPSKVALP